MTDKGKHIQLVSAVLLIVSSIALAFIQALTIQDIANGVLMYIAQSFLLAGSIFGLDYYVQRLYKLMTHDKEKPSTGNQKP